MQLKMPAVCAWTRGHPLSSAPDAVGPSVEPDVQDQKRLGSCSLLAPGHGVLGAQAPFFDPCTTALGSEPGTTSPAGLPQQLLQCEVVAPCHPHHVIVAMP